MTAVLNIKDIPIGSSITFKSKNPTDLVQWRGKLESFGSYRSIRHLRDPRSYNEAVRQIDNSVSSDITELSYFVITVDNQSEQPYEQAFANEWIVDGSLTQIDLGSQVTIKIDDPNNDPQTILAILAEAGYTGTIITT